MSANDEIEDSAAPLIEHLAEEIGGNGRGCASATAIVSDCSFNSAA